MAFIATLQSGGRAVAGILLAGLGLALHGAVAAATVDLAAGADLAQAIAAAQPGDRLRLAPGTYAGEIVIDKPLTLEGPEDRSAIIAGTRQGRTLWIKAADVSVRNLTVTRSGLNLPEMDAGVFLDRSAHRAVVEHNDILDNLFGVYIWGPDDAMVRGNRIVGNRELRVAERGNGVSLWNTPGSAVVDNDISAGRDGVFVNTSKKNRFVGNRFHELRYGVHYMYTNDSEISGNVSTGNDIGYAIMYSHRLIVTGNVALNNVEQGLMMNYANDSNISGNTVNGAGKCVFIYNANKNRFRDNHFSNCEIGVHFTAGSDGNEISGNAFINNKNQVKYVGTRVLEWSAGGRGNYWSDNTAFDLNGDGIADTAYRPNDVVDQLLWRAPSARILLNSPAISVVRWAQSQFPAILPGGVIDSAPLMKPTAASARHAKETQ
ncbi:nitrous oxide reductase family maturation protein NosD [Achromobacter deleyi]|uniref:nitrous oxide reductase family maturation protein NosD n=1 Tax=Achromobacter deleyi TaxID=1353891 RepID=UPI00149108BD|nr:nitrous oxide reductase family maturation protein NosD [Achromobacter deleyi]QVQ27140.1 nitrous oxide reductase family maturation protein NosD [Achromobacter deleyi]UIP22728.1 nitrous oxide reductase family maturation protein NosD [Achromobacter deleyi]